MDGGAPYQINHSASPIHPGHDGSGFQYGPPANGNPIYQQYPVANYNLPPNSNINGAVNVDSHQYPQPLAFAYFQIPL